MKTSTIINRMNEVVKNLTPSGYKMGDLFTLTVGEHTVKHDTREYYSGRGNKYNNSIRHGSISITMTVTELNKAYKPIAQRNAERKASQARYNEYLRTCNDPANIQAAVVNAVNVIADMPAPEGDNRYWINGYHGCGVYRIVWKDGKIVATIHGGFHDSCPNGVDKMLWNKAIMAYLTERFGSDYKVVKMDGSGCEFFFRDMEDADMVTIGTEVYYVPDARGGMHPNIQPIEAHILEPNQIENV